MAFVGAAGIFENRCDSLARYREDTYQFVSSPVRNSPWTLLVFAEAQPLRAMHGHILTSGLGLYVGYLLFLLLVGVTPWLGYEAYRERTHYSVRGLFYSLWPDRCTEPGYPSHFEVRKVGHGGFVKLNGQKLFISKVLYGEHVGFEEVEEGIWNLFFDRVLLGRFDERAERLHHGHP